MFGVLRQRRSAKLKHESQSAVFAPCPARRLLDGTRVDTRVMPFAHRQYTSFVRPLLSDSLTLERVLSLLNLEDNSTSFSSKSCTFLKILFKLRLIGQVKGLQ